MERPAFARSLVVCLFVAGCSYVAAQQRVFAPVGCLETVPPPPESLRARAVNESAITVTWRAPRTDACIDTFDYFVVEKGQPQPRTLNTKKRQSYSLTVTGLKPGVEYTVHVASVNNVKGRGQFAMVNAQTRRERCTIFSTRRPTAVTDIHFVQTTPNTAQISWLPPETGCPVWYNVDTLDINTGRRTSRRVSFDADTVVQVRQNARYVFSISAFSLFGGEGPPVTAQLSTASVAPQVGR